MARFAADQMQDTARDRHVGIRWKNIDRIHHDVHSLGCLKHRQTRRPGQQLDQRAFMRGIEMGYEDQSHTRFWRKSTQQVAERFKATGGGTDGYDGKCGWRSKRYNGARAPFLLAATLFAWRFGHE